MARGLTSDPATITWRADGVRPVVTISSPTEGATTGRSVSVTFSSEVGATFECKVGNGSFAACTSPLALLLPSGPASVTIHAADPAGNLSADATRSWTVDATGPTVNVSVSPLVNGRTRADGAVTYSSPEGGVTFRCRTYLSSSAPPPFGACAPSPFNLSGFTNGQSVKIDVEGRDAFDNPTIGSATVTIDAQGPAIQTGQCTQPGLDESTTDCQIAVTDNDVASVQCRIVGVTGFANCQTDASFKNVTVEDLAAGVNTIEVRAVDDLGNIGSPGSFRPVVATYRSGHIVLEGHDYVAINGDTARILSNAVKLSYVFTHNLGRPPQVLIWCSTSTCDSTEENNVKDILLPLGVTANEITEFFDPNDLLGKGLVPRHDVFIVHDQNGRHGANLDDIGKGWTAPMIDNFVVRGATLIVLDGMDASGGQPSGTFELLVGPGALTNIRVLRDATNDNVNFGVSDPALQAGVNNPYTGPKYTIAYLVSDDRWLKSFFINTDQTMVIHRIF
jgi:hypothetical protein